MKHRLALTASAWVLAALCAAGSVAFARPPATPPLPAAFEAAPGDAALSPAELDHWWRLYKDPTLEALEAEAFRAAPDARTQMERLKEAKATLSGQVAQTLPTGQIKGSASRQKSDSIAAGAKSLFPVGGVTEVESASFAPSWEIDLFGRLAEARKIAKASVAATRLDVEAARAALAANVADGYFQAVGLNTQVADARETVRIQTGLLDVARRKAELGLGSPSDADRIAGDLAQARTQLEELQAQFSAVRRQLLILIGRGADPVESLKLGAIIDPPPTPKAIPAELLARRPDLREAEAKLRIQAGTAKLRHLAIFPTFTFMPQLGLTRNVQPSVGYNPTTGAFFPVQQTTNLGYWTWAGNVTIPTFDIPRLLFEAKAEDARTRQAAIAFEKAVQTAYGETENVLNSLAAAKRGADILTEGEARAHRAYDAARERYSRGLDDLTTALSAESAWRNTHSALTNERVQALRRSVAVYKALGGGWDAAARGLTP